MLLSEAIQALGQPKFFHPRLAELFGLAPGILLSNLIYWTGKGKVEGWIYKSADDLQAETSLTYRQQKWARAELVKRGIIVERHERAEHRIYFQIQESAFELAVAVMATATKEAPDKTSTAPTAALPAEAPDKTSTAKTSSGTLQNVDCHPTKRQVAPDKMSVRNRSKITTENTHTLPTEGIAATASAVPAHDDAPQGSEMTNRELPCLPGPLAEQRVGTWTTGKVVCYLPLCGEVTTWAPVTRGWVDEMQSLYPGIDVKEQLRRYKGWALNNPKKRKTARGLASSVNTWLQEEQNRAGRNGRPANVSTNREGNIRGIDLERKLSAESGYAPVEVRDLELAPAGAT